MSRSLWNFAGRRSRCDGAGEEDIGSSSGADDLDHHPLEVRAVVPMARLRSQACRHLVVLRQEHFAPA
jgi:UDP-N-acetylmuramate-alanine ligase